MKYVNKQVHKRLIHYSIFLPIVHPIYYILSDREISVCSGAFGQFFMFTHKATGSQNLQQFTATGILNRNIIGGNRGFKVVHYLYSFGEMEG